MDDRQRIEQWFATQRQRGLVDVKFDFDPESSFEERLRDLRLMVDAIENGQFTEVSGL